MRIVHAVPVYAPAWQFGGPVLSVSRLCEALARSGHEVRVITTNAGITLPEDSLGKPMMRNGVEVTYFPKDQNKRIIYSSALEALLPEVLIGADICHLSEIEQTLHVLSRVSQCLKVNMRGVQESGFVRSDDVCCSQYFTQLTLFHG